MGFKAMRNRAGLTLVDVGNAVGVSDAAVSQWETGKTMPRAELLLRIAAIYHCTVEELLSDETPGGNRANQ